MNFIHGRDTTKVNLNDYSIRGNLLPSEEVIADIIIRDKRT